MAGCASDQIDIMYCELEDNDKYLSICFDDTAALYEYGKIDGEVELSLQEPFKTFEFTPWSGLGKAIWEEYTFNNNEYSYIVNAGFHRPWGDEIAGSENRHFGSITVKRNDEEIAVLNCKSTSWIWGVADDAMIAAGYQWDSHNSQWLSTAE